MMPEPLEVPPSYVLFSGGKDSFATACKMEEQDRLLGIVMLDTGIAVPEWRDECVAICEQRKWKWEIIPTTTRYEWFVWRFGFPGPAMHAYAMRYLKGRGVAFFKKVHPGATLASGVRETESARRAINTKPISDFEKVTVYAPIYKMTTPEVWAYVKAKGYSRLSVYSKLGISGDCLCGAYAREDEREAVRVHYPKVNVFIERLEKDAKDRGQKHCSWGWACKAKRPPKTPQEAITCFECGDATDEALLG